MDYDKIIFKNKKFSDLLEEIYNNTRKKDKKIDEMVKNATSRITELGHIQTLGPIIKDYLDVGVKNNDMLVKLATIVQRLETAVAKGEGSADFFADGELEKILNQSEEMFKGMQEKGKQSD